MDKPDTKSMSLFERQLTLWVGLCILAGIGLGKLAPGLAQALDGMAIYVNGAPVEVTSAEQQDTTEPLNGVRGLIRENQPERINEPPI